MGGVVQGGEFADPTLMLSPNLPKPKVDGLVEWGGRLLTQLLMLSPNLPKTQSWWWCVSGGGEY